MGPVVVVVDADAVAVVVARGNVMKGVGRREIDCWVSLVLLLGGGTLGVPEFDAIDAVVEVLV